MVEGRKTLSKINSRELAGWHTKRSLKVERNILRRSRRGPKSVDRKKVIVEPKKTPSPCRVTEEDVKTFLVSRVPNATSFEIKHVCKSEECHVSEMVVLADG